MLLYLDLHEGVEDGLHLVGVVGVVVYCHQQPHYSAISVLVEIHLAEDKHLLSIPPDLQYVD